MNVAGVRGRRKGICGGLAGRDVGSRVRIRGEWRKYGYGVWVNDVHEAVGLVDPIFIVVRRVRFIIRLCRASRKTVRTMGFSRDMYEFEVEEEDAGDPAVDSGVGLNVQVIEHSFDVLGVHFDDEVPDTYDPESGGSEGTE